MKRFILAVAALCLLGIPAIADAPPSFLLKWGSKGTGAGQFRSPRGVAIDASGFVYVADRMNARVEKFDSNGAFVTQWPSTAPHGIAVAPNGNIYVTLQVDDRVEYYSSSGSLLGSWGGTGSSTGRFVTPKGIAVDENNDIYVVDTNERVQKFTSTGTFLQQWGSFGTSDGQFDAVEGIASDRNGHVLVSDGDRIQIFSTLGVREDGWATNGRIRFLACNSVGQIYASDEDHDNVKKFSAQGVLLTSFGQCCSNDGEFIQPSGIAVNSSEEIYVADSYNGFQNGNNRIQKFGSVPTPTTKHSWGALKTRYR